MIQVSYLRIPAIRQPAPCPGPQPSRHGSLPCCAPALHVLGRELTWGAEQMYVVRHDHIGLHAPRINVAPRIHKCLVRAWIVQTMVGVRFSKRHSHHQHRRAFGQNNGRMVRRTPTARQVMHGGSSGGMCTVQAMRLAKARPPGRVYDTSSNLARSPHGRRSCPAKPRRSGVRSRARGLRLVARFYRWCDGGAEEEREKLKTPTIPEEP